MWGRRASLPMEWISSYPAALLQEPGTREVCVCVTDESLVSSLVRPKSITHVGMAIAGCLQGSW